MIQMKFKWKNKICLKLLALFLLTALMSGIIQVPKVLAETEDTIVLRVGSWEEYIDQGDWGEDEEVDLESETITSENGLISDFEEWYFDTFGKHVKVEYSTFGTNEDLYSKLILGEAYDIVCPSEYMFSKLLKENMLEPLSKDFFDTSNEYNYYTNGVSPFIKELFEKNKIDGKPWSDYAAGYMWGTMGIVYNPDEVDEDDVSGWDILVNPKYAKRVTIKDSVRESYFPALAILNKDLLLTKEFRENKDYYENLAKAMNDTRPETIEKVEDLLQRIRQNVYSFETDSGKADMITGKIVANVQWSGDGAYAMEQAEEEGYYLYYSVPEECTNLWLDGWVMLKSGIAGNSDRKKAAEAFINFISRADNAIRNMYYIGYTSCISGGNNPLIYEYVKWKFEAEDESDAVEYPMGYFFSGDDADENYNLKTTEDYSKRLLFVQYPPKEVIDRSAIMGYMSDDVTSQLNQMWINVRCFNFDQVPGKVWLWTLAIICLVILLILVWSYRYRIFRRVHKG
ncbi:extracellular solute-binding protein [Ruminiclostridium herbifermentans]|uniref:Extracellular solute-binding protein n=1 Tax=Ruminiclostridium herbifermentans TaxID=2488810 RepID=A0A4U7JLS7_9FIRM|nr:extracellular solute-binding protein [Ruminiclostridium herbifermentans]QNU66142.1 extracellular solute-binding protein [Ruminiclostridium herbifermentans]